MPVAPRPVILPGKKLLALVKFDTSGLVPVAVVDRESGELLMLAWSNRRALELSLSTGFTHFWSRSRKSLWKKGETTGHVQRIESLELDCDGDTLVARVDQTGVACHTGSPTCFYRRTTTDSSSSSRILFELLRTIRSRRGTDPEKSYTAKLLSQSAEKRGKKLLEEASELLLASVELERAGKKPAGKGRVADPAARVAAISEAADVLYHYLVALEGLDLRLTDVWQELGKRFGLSGIEEKRRRKKT